MWLNRHMYTYDKIIWLVCCAFAVSTLPLFCLYNAYICLFSLSVVHKTTLKLYILYSDVERLWVSLLSYKSGFTVDIQLVYQLVSTLPSWGC